MFLLIFLLLLLFPKQSFATPVVKITNYSSNSSPEWVEIQNQTSDTISVGGWTIRDGNSSQTDDLTLIGCVSPNSYLTFYHDSGWLNDSGDTITLYDASSAQIDQLIYTDGQLVLTPRSDSNCTPSSTPSPTSAPTLTPSPTTPLLPTITPSPTNTPVPTNTPTPTPAVLGDSTASPTHSNLLPIIFITAGGLLLLVPLIITKFPSVKKTQS